jgi:hypothetical protein
LHSIPYPGLSFLFIVLYFIKMPLYKRVYCNVYSDGTTECYEPGFWYTDKGIIIKWSILAAIFFFFMAWFVGGYMHAMRRLRAGKPLLAYHRWLVPYKQRQRYGQAPQNHFTFYAAQPQPYGQRPDGTYPEPPPLYTNDAPPQYMPPPGATKAHPMQTYETHLPAAMPPAGMHSQPTEAYPMAPQQTGFVGGSSNGNALPEQQLPPRPERVKTAASNFLSRFRK